MAGPSVGGLLLHVFVPQRVFCSPSFIALYLLAFSYLISAKRVYEDFEHKCAMTVIVLNGDRQVPARPDLLELGQIHSKLEIVSADSKADLQVHGYWHRKKFLKILLPRRCKKTKILDY